MGGGDRGVVLPAAADERGPPGADARTCGHHVAYPPALALHRIYGCKNERSIAVSS
ncbi:hypothetical protein GCM10009608_71060 [Pseudonocardia alaniniphila]